MNGWRFYQGMHENMQMWLQQFESFFAIFFIAFMKDHFGLNANLLYQHKCDFVPFLLNSLIQYGIPNLKILLKVTYFFTLACGFFWNFNLKIFSTEEQSWQPCKMPNITLLLKFSISSIRHHKKNTKCCSSRESWIHSTELSLTYLWRHKVYFILTECTTTVPLR